MFGLLASANRRNQVVAAGGLTVVKFTQAATTDTTSSTYQVAATLTETVTAGDYILSFGTLIGSTSASIPDLRVMHGSTELGFWRTNTGSANDIQSWTGKIKLTLTAASHTFTIEYRGNGTSTTVYNPALILIGGLPA